MEIFVLNDCLKSLFKLKTGYEVHLIGHCRTDKSCVIGFCVFCSDQFSKSIGFLYKFFAKFDINLSKGTVTDFKLLIYSDKQIKSLSSFINDPA